MTSTDDLIRSLASAAGTRRSASLQAAFAVTGAASLACALLLVFSVIGIRQDFADMAVRLPFAFKVVYTGALVVGASVVALYAARPGASATALYAISPAENDGTAFVATWYTAACAIMAFIGAVVGHRALRW